MNNILIIIVNIKGFVQGARQTREFLNFWKECYKLTILTIDNFDDKIFNHPNVEVINFPYSIIFDLQFISS